MSRASAAGGDKIFPHLIGLIALRPQTALMSKCRHCDVRECRQREIIKCCKVDMARKKVLGMRDADEVAWSYRHSGVVEIVSNRN